MEKIPEAFRTEAEQVISHLYDYAFLENHSWVNKVLPSSPAKSSSRAQRLRKLVLESIEELSPPGQMPINSPQWRAHRILCARYVDKQAPSEVISELSLSERQFYREQRKAMDALVGLLWERCARRWRDQTGGSVSKTDQSSREPREQIESLVSHPEALDLGSLLDEVLASVSALQDQHRLQITYSVDDRLPTMWLNRTLARHLFLQVLSELATNTKGLRVHIDLSPEGEAVLVTVHAEAGAGTSACKDIEWESLRWLVDVVGGQLHQVGKRTEECLVCFTIPHATPRRLMVVEDNPAAVQLLRRYLVRENYSIVVATTGQEAMTLAVETKPDAILLDLLLPDRDGWESLADIKANPATQSVPVLVCSVLDEHEIAQTMGADAYLRKPFSKQDVLLALDTLIDQAN